jgi:hypothetical protein
MINYLSITEEKKGELEKIDWVGRRRGENSFFWWGGRVVAGVSGVREGFRVSGRILLFQEGSG